MYPDPSNFQSGNPGAAWAVEGTITTDLMDQAAIARVMDGEVLPGEKVIVTQWDALLRNFQNKARTLLPAQWSFNLTTGESDKGPTLRASDSVAVTGKWDQITAEALGHLLAQAGEKPADILIYLPKADGVVPIQTIRALFNIANYITKVGTVAQPGLDAAEFERARKLRIPPNYVSPSVNVAVTSAAADANWSATFDPATQSKPVSPSQAAAGITPDGAQKGMGTGSKLLIAAAVIGIGYLVLSSADDDSRENPSPRMGNERLRAYGRQIGRLNRVPDHGDLTRKGYSQAQESMIISEARAERNRVYGAPRVVHRTRRSPQDEVTVVRRTTTTTG